MSASRNPDGIGYYDEHRDEIVDDDDEFCDCGACHDDEELAWGKCDACGRFIYDESDWDDAGEDDPQGGFLLDCGDPECVMPGPHFRSECHTAEMIEATNAEIQCTADTTKGA